MRGYTNIKPEHAWARLRDMWSKGFEDMFNEGIQNQWYNPINILDRYTVVVNVSMSDVLTLDSLTFRWLAIHFVQCELDLYVTMHNTASRRANKHKVLPHSVPQQMFMHPSTANSYDFKVWLRSMLLHRSFNLCQIVVPKDMLDAAEEEWAPPNDPVFQLIPPDFESHVTRCYEALGEPVVNFDTFWDVYCGLWDLVETAVPDVVAGSLSQSAMEDDCTPEPFALTHCQDYGFHAQFFSFILSNSLHFR